MSCARGPVRSARGSRGSTLGSSYRNSIGYPASGTRDRDAIDYLTASVKPAARAGGRAVSTPFRKPVSSALGTDDLDRRLVEPLDDPCQPRLVVADPETFSDGSDLRVCRGLEAHGVPRMRSSVAVARRRLGSRCPSVVRPERRV